jgi:hypothetical protein
MQSNVAGGVWWCSVFAAVLLGAGVLGAGRELLYVVVYPHLLGERAACVLLCWGHGEDPGDEGGEEEACGDE